MRQLTPKGIGIGLENGEVFNRELEEIELRLDHGDVILFFTDGIIEARNSEGQDFDINTLINIIQNNGYVSASQLRKKNYFTTERIHRQRRCA